MRAFQIVLLFLAAAVLQTNAQDCPPNDSNSGCQESHDDVMRVLEITYGDHNCEREQFENGEGNIECIFQIDNQFFSNATYQYRFFDCKVPVRPYFMNVQKVTYPEGGGYKVLNSFTDFSSFCLAGFVGLYFNEVLYRREQYEPTDCSNSDQPITYMKGNTEKSITCRKLGRTRTRKLWRLCRKFSEISNACKGICKTGSKCQCENNPEEFPKKKQGGRTTCEELAALDDPKMRKKKCKRRRYKSNCPGVCVCAQETVVL